MKNCLITCAALASLAMPATLQAQQQSGTWVETRFHRVHLLNGNFIDGQLIGESDRTLTMRVGGGEMQIRKDMIGRTTKGNLRVEYVKMRSYNEPLKLEPIRNTRPPGPSVSSPAVTTPKAPPSTAPAETVTLTGPVEEQLAQAADILKNGTPARKKGAIQALAALGADAAKFLAGVFGTLEDGLVPDATSVLSNLKEASIVSTMKGLLGSDRAVIRENAADLVGQLGAARDDSGSLRELLRDRDPGVRGAAVIALRRLSDFESFDIVAEMLSDPDKNVRTKALVTLTDMAQKGSLTPKLIAVFNQTLEQTQGEARIELLKEAGNQASPELAPVLIRLGADSDPMVRSHAIAGIGKLRTPEAVDFVVERMSIEREYWPRIALTGAAMTMKLQKAIDPLIEWLGDENAEIRAAAMRALQGITNLRVGSDRQAWEEWRHKTRQNN
jgi:HEAT repeat protein